MTIVLTHSGSGMSGYDQLEDSVAVLPKFIFEVSATKLEQHKSENSLAIHEGDSGYMN